MLNSGVCMVPRRSASALLQGARSELGRELGWLYYAPFPFSLALYFYARKEEVYLLLLCYTESVKTTSKHSRQPKWLGKTYNMTGSAKGASKRILRSDWLNEWDTNRDFPLKMLVEFLWRNLFSVFPEQPSKQRFWKRPWITALDLAAEFTNWKS